MLMLYVSILLFFFIPRIFKASFKHNPEGRTPLAYAVAKDMDRMVRDLIDMGANVNALMGETTTPLTIAVTNKKR